MNDGNPPQDRPQDAAPTDDHAVPLDPGSSPRGRTNRVALAMVLGLVVVALIVGAFAVIALVRAVDDLADAAPAPASSDSAATEDRAHDDGGTAGEVVTGPSGAPAGANADGGIVVGVDGVGRYTPGAPVVLIYTDYMCPYCAQFEAANGAMLEDLRVNGLLTVVHHPVAFLDRYSEGTRYSTRAAQAVAVVADAAPEALTAFHAALLEQQPEEGTPGLTDPRIAQVALAVGVPKAVAGTFTEGRFAEWVATASQRAADAGVPGTPAIVVEGEVFEGDWRDPAALRAAILDD